MASRLYDISYEHSNRIAYENSAGRHHNETDAHSWTCAQMHAFSSDNTCGIAFHRDHTCASFLAASERHDDVATGNVLM
jgi:hypothetical protein